MKLHAMLGAWCVPGHVQHVTTPADMTDRDTHAGLTHWMCGMLIGCSLDAGSVLPGAAAEGFWLKARAAGHLMWETAAKTVALQREVACCYERHLRRQLHVKVSVRW